MSIVYKKDDGVENEDVWDDTELIKMYEDCVSATYSKLGVAATTSSWNVGDRCLARYSEDDLYYPAKIVETGEKGSQTEYLVLFEGYGNSEWVSADDIVAASSDDGSQEDGNVTMDSAPDDTPVKSYSVKVTKAKKERTLRKGTSNASKTGHSSCSHPSIPSIAPPPPMVMPRLRVPDEAEALSSMLMAWYMSGYHTGYYQAIRDMNSNS